MRLNTILLFCLELFFPPRCIFCGRTVAPGTKICSGCAAEVLPLNAVRCMNLPAAGKISVAPSFTLTRDASGGP